MPIYIIDDIRPPRSNVEYNFHVTFNNYTASDITPWSNSLKMGGDIGQDFNVLYLTKSLIGPQDITMYIDLLAKVTKGARTKVIKVHRSILYIFVSQFDRNSF